MAADDGRANTDHPAGPARRDGPPRPSRLLAWSGGKDSMLALYHLCRGLPEEVPPEEGEPDTSAGADVPAEGDGAGGVPLAGLLTTVTEEYDRISMHGVRRCLLQRQAKALDLPLWTVEIPPDASNDVYEKRMANTLKRARRQGIASVAFGDLFLSDVRAYRERQMASVDMQAEFPLWGRDTAALARSFIRLGWRAYLVCVDPEQLDPSFCGRPYDDTLLADLPPGVDPCGEDGEFHTFVWDGPLLQRAVPVQRKQRVERGGFVFSDLVEEPTS